MVVDVTGGALYEQWGGGYDQEISVLGHSCYWCGDNIRIVVLLVWW